MDIKRVLKGLSIAVTLLWVLVILAVFINNHRRPPVWEFGFMTIAPVAVWWGLLYGGFWVTRGSAAHTFILGISALAFMGVFFFVFGFSILTEGDIDEDMFIGSLLLAAGTSILVATVLSYRQRAKQVPQPPYRQRAQQVPQPPPPDKQ